MASSVQYLIRVRAETHSKQIWTLWRHAGELWLIKVRGIKCKMYVTNENLEKKNISTIFNMIIIYK